MFQLSCNKKKYFALMRISICFVSRKCISLRNSRHQEVSSYLHSKLSVKRYMDLQWHGFVVLLYSTRYHSDNDTALLKSWVIIIMSFKICFRTFVQDFPRNNSFRKSYIDLSIKSWHKLPNKTDIEWLFRTFVELLFKLWVLTCILLSL